ncbi:MAG: diguanylate cyclase, partial [Proteobacteria bacterium]|nr:diguanylate cyclase [Pseudomonadota bacterium]
MARLRLNIAKKLLLGYLPLTLLTVVVASLTLVSLNRLNRITDRIVRVDVPLVEAADQLVDHLLAQDFYSRRYLLLRDPALAEVFRQRGEDFRDALGRFRAVRGRSDPWASALEVLHGEYEALVERSFSEPGELDPVADRALRRKQGDILEALRREAVDLRRARDRKTLQASEIGTRAFRVTAVLCLLGAAVAGGAAAGIARSITGAVRRLKVATGEIAEGRFDRVPELTTGDELEDLARAFGSMAVRLQRMEQMCLDASPLTRLPGGEAIEDALRQRAEGRQPLAFCLLDLDSFKGYSDKYGYAKGSEVIKVVARILESAVDEVGQPEDFIGHIGGDDFVLLTVPERCRALCAEVIRRFDEAVPDFYSQEDRERGFIRGKSRDGEPTTFPLLSLSIAVVTDPAQVHRDPLSVGEAAARLKECGKALPGSVYVIDREWQE